jgi:septum formation protein
LAILQSVHSFEILLASRSPRREALVKKLGIPFRVVEVGHDHEAYPPGLEAGEIARFLADHKSNAYHEPLDRHQILLTADTIVWHLGRELGKPGNSKEAIEMIRGLSGDTHQVYTGVCLRTRDARTSFYARTDVTFSKLDDEEIESYVRRFKPFDKAGGYGIQEWIGTIAVEKIVGSYFNVMGLPVQRVYQELKSFTGII